MELKDLEAKARKRRISAGSSTTFDTRWLQQTPITTVFEVGFDGSPALRLGGCFSLRFRPALVGLDLQQSNGLSVGCACQSSR
jgi:hypothetical protein